jgi:hypothetical protein
MCGYDFRFLNVDGSLSMFFRMQCVDDDHADRTARELAPVGCARYEIWSDKGCTAESAILRTVA